MIGGKYAGRVGWKHKKKGETTSEIYVILQAQTDAEDNVVKPEITVRIKKDNYMLFVQATSAVQVMIEQKPAVQAKMTALIKELVKLQVTPTEDFLIVFGHQWITMHERKTRENGVDYNHRDEVPQASDDEQEADEID